MATLPSQKLQRLVKLCGMLSSDFPGERATAAKMATDLLREEKLTWAEFLLNGIKLTGPQTSPPPPSPHPTWRGSRPVVWREQARECLQYPDELSEWEKEFLGSILRQARARPSERQAEVLTRIYDRLFDKD